MGKRPQSRGEEKDLALMKGRQQNVEKEEETALRWTWSGLQLSVTVVLAGVYVATMHRSLPGGDAGELIVAADQRGVAHPPGYPLYTMLMKMGFLLIPYGSVAFKANLLTALMAAAAGGYLFQAVYLLRGSVAAGLLAAGMFSFSRLTWTWSTGAEVFALNNLLLAVLVVTAVRFSQESADHRVKLSLVGAFVCGLCLSNQHTSVVYVGVLALWVLFTLFRDKVLSLCLLLQISLSFLAGLLPYVYLPISAMTRQTPWTWGDQSTFEGFLTHLLRSEYGTLHLLKGHEGQGLIQGLIAYMEHVVEDLSAPVLFLSAMVTFSIFRRNRRQQSEVLVVSVVMLTVYAVLFAWRANLDINSPLYLRVVERFWMQSDIVLMLLAAVAFSDVVSMVDRFAPLQRWKLDVVVAVLLVSVQLRCNLSSCDQSKNVVIRDFALTTLKAFPRNAVVLTKGDLPSTSLRYFHVSERVRPDLIVVDQEVLTYDWSVPMMAPHLSRFVFPGDQLYTQSGLSTQGRKLFTFQQLLDANYDRKPLFGCVGVQDHEPSWQQTYELRPFGVCMQFIKKGIGWKAGLKDWLQTSHNFAANWPHPLPERDATWDDVASSEMWRAKTVAAFYLLENAHKAGDEERAAWLKEAYQIYSEAFKSSSQAPAYWHKNFALVCEKLRHVSLPSEIAPLIRTSIKHFQIYLKSGTVDPQRDAIESAVRSLGKYVEHLQGV